MYRIAPWLTTLCLLAAACGGGSESTQSGPQIPGHVAEELAAQADAVAATFESGDVCRAAQKADELLASVTAAVENGRIPAELQDSLEATATDLVNEINCPEPTTTQRDCTQLEEQKDALQKAKDEAKGKGKKRRLEEQLHQLEQQIDDCHAQQGGEGND